MGAFAIDILGVRLFAFENFVNIAAKLHQFIFRSGLSAGYLLNWMLKANCSRLLIKIDMDWGHSDDWHLRSSIQTFRANLSGNLSL